MRLRTFESFWLLNNGLLNSYPSLQNHNEETEIVVVGGGITGALISHALMEKNYKVILLDKRDIAMGSTAATTSMLQYEIDVPLYQLSKMIGEKEAVECYKAGIKAIIDLGGLMNTRQFDCGFEKKQSLFIARNKRDAVWLKREFEIRNKYNLGVQWLDAKAVLNDFGIKCFGAILSEVAGSVDAYRLTHELIKFNCERGMKVFDQTAIKNIDCNTLPVSIYTESNCKITCKKVVFCTGYEATSMLKEKIADLFYTYACISEQNIELNKNLKNTLVWDTGSPYIYMRTTDDGRLLIGGEDSTNNSPLFKNSVKERKAKLLQKHLKKIAPAVSFTEDFTWAGTFGSTKDGLPYIGESPEYLNSLFVLGFGGNGITFSIQAMNIIPDLLEHIDNPLSYYYRFGR
ncbi:MAG: FAD-dependent oxidoreductase [Bacteroidota bacterium]